MARQFDKYMIAIGAGRHVKFRRLSTPERYAFFLGVLSIAAQAPIRGLLLVGELNAEAEDVAAEADVPVRVACSALAKLRAVGIIVRDEEHDCEAVHDFDDWNPLPKNDGTNAERQRRYRARRNARGDVTGNGAVTASNAGEVEVEVEVTPLAPQGGNGVTHSDPSSEQHDLPSPPVGGRGRDKHQFDLDVQTYSRSVLSIDSDEGWRNVRGAILAGAKSTDAVVSWLREWRPDVLPVEAAS